MNRLFAVVAVLLCWTIIDIGTAKALCPENMVSYWKLNEDAMSQDFGGYFDETGHANTAICLNNCPVINSQGVNGNSQMFNGINTGIDAPANTRFDFGGSNSFSIELWIKRSPGIFSREVLIGRDDADTNMQWWLSISASGGAAFSLTSAGGESIFLESNKILDNMKWHHIAVVWDAENRENRLYVDGKIEDFDNIIYNSEFKSTAPINIGYLNGDTPGSFFGGSLDEVAIYGRVLAINEIKMHYYLSREYCSPGGVMNRSNHNDTPVRIMPLGDSITYDNHEGDIRPATERTGYRWPLWLWLENAGYQVDFVGSEEAGADIVPAFDYDNAGFPGITDDQLAVLLDTGVNQFPEPDVRITDGPYLESYPADVILLHIGTNNVEADTTGVENILDEIDEYSEQITVIIARIINRIGGSQVTTIYNNLVETMVNNRVNNDGDKIILVDMEDGAEIIYDFTANGGDMYDALHPDNVVDPFVVDSGYGKMADVWFASLQDFLSGLENDDNGNSGSDGPLCFIGVFGID